MHLSLINYPHNFNVLITENNEDDQRTEASICFNALNGSARESLCPDCETLNESNTCY